MNMIIALIKAVQNDYMKLSEDKNQSVLFKREHTWLLFQKSCLLTQDHKNLSIKVYV